MEMVRHPHLQPLHCPVVSPPYHPPSTSSSSSPCHSFSAAAPPAQAYDPSPPSSPSGKGSGIVDTDEILDAVHRIRRSVEGSRSNELGTIESLDELLRFSVHDDDNDDGVPADARTVLQIGGRDPHLLAKASAIGAAFGCPAVNLNCGCPSSAVSGRSGGASLMKEPGHVARCVIDHKRATIQNRSVPPYVPTS